MNGRTFATSDEDYFDLVHGMRSGEAAMHGYDWVEGPLLMNPQHFLAGESAMTAGHQISFHTTQAIETLFQGLLP
jgi:hypothetical protein